MAGAAACGRVADAAAEAAPPLRVVSAPQLGGAAAPLVARAPAASLRPGDAVHVWDRERKRWYEDGVVLDAEASSHTAGSLRVSFDGGGTTRWLPPQHCQRLSPPPSGKQGASLGLLVRAGRELLRASLAAPAAASEARGVASAEPAERGQGAGGESSEPEPPEAGGAELRAAGARDLLRIALGALGAERGTQDMLAELRAARRHCRRVGRPFTDADFPTPTGGRVTCWCRPGQIQAAGGRPLGGRRGLLPLLGLGGGPPRADWQLFRERPRAEDVLQGELGDCWFLSSLAVVAEFEEGRFVRELLPEQERLDEAGAYLVRLCLGGKWHGVIVDDRLPCLGGGMYCTQLAYCVTNRLQLWASLVEKGFAKACGSYEALTGGEAGEALTMLTGWPSKMIVFDRRFNPRFDPDTLWAELCFSGEVGFLMTCSTKAVASSSLEPFHVYSLLSVHEVPLEGAGRSERLLKIRNPHGKTRWKGPWSDESALWSPQLRELVGCPSGGSKQVFVMSLGDFLREFAHVTICRVHSRHQWKELRAPVHIPTLSVPRVALSLQASDKTECSVSLSQPNERVRSGRIFYDHPEPLACIGFALCTPTSQGGQRAVGVGGLCCSPAASLDCWLEPGEQYLLVPLSLHPGASLTASFACMSSQDIVIRERCLDIDAVRAAWAAYARFNDASGQKFHGATLHLGKAEGGSLVALAENRTGMYFFVELHVESRCMWHSRAGQAVTRDVVPPGYGQVLTVALPHPVAVARGQVSWRSTHRFGMATEEPRVEWHRPSLGPDEHDLHAPFRL